MPFRPLPVLAALLLCASHVDAPHIGAQSRAPAPSPAPSRTDSSAWSPPTPDGSRVLLLHGERARPGTPYVYALALPAGFAGHVCHDAGAEVTVLRGSLRLTAASLAEGERVALAAGRIHGLAADRSTVIVVATRVSFPVRREPGAPRSGDNRC